MDLFAELSATGALAAEYSFDPATDDLGSVEGLFGASGLENQYRYDPWGAPQVAAGSVPNRLRYAAREWDADAGLLYLRARYYDPALGRFLSEDPLGLSAGINPYAYVGNSPTNGTDPTGLDPDCTVEQASVGACVIGVDEVNVVTRLWSAPCPTCFLPTGLHTNTPSGPEGGLSRPGRPGAPSGGGGGFGGLVHKVTHFISSHAECEEAIGLAALNGTLDFFGGREVLGGLRLTTGFVHGFFENRALAKTGFTFARKFLRANLRDAGATAARTVGADVRGAAEATATISVAETVTTFHLPSVRHAAGEFVKAVLPGAATIAAGVHAFKTCTSGGG